MMNKFIIFVFMAITFSIGCGASATWHGSHGRDYNQTRTAYGQPTTRYGRGYEAPSQSVSGYYVSQYVGSGYDPRTHPAIAQWYALHHEAVSQPRATSVPVAPSAAPQAIVQAAESPANNDAAFAALREQVIAQQRAIHQLQQEAAEHEEAPTNIDVLTTGDTI